jgi:hypothetical protein
MIRTHTAAFVVTRVTGILAATFLVLGIAFAIIGLMSGPEAFLILGVILAWFGLDLAIFAVVWRRRTRASAR